MTLQRRPPESESGVALLAVLIALIVISALVIGMVAASRASIGEARSDQLSSEARAFSDAVILQTCLDILDTTSPNRLRIDGIPQAIPVLGQMVPVSVSSEFGKVDLNATDANTLTHLLESAGLGPAIATEEATQIMNRRMSGTGDAEPRLFRSVSELALVPGITNNVFQIVEPAVTVYSGRGGVDENTAPLLALEAGAGMDRLSAESYIRERNSSLGTNAFGEVVHGQLQPGVSVTGWAFSIVARFNIGARQENLYAVVRMTGNATKLYLTLWQNMLPD